jgi:hypothetical protein
MIMDTVFVAWQQPETNEWIPVARLDREHGKFRFSYRKGALRAKEFQPFGRMDDLTKSYESETLFPLFSNRLISKSRPEFKNYLRWLDLPDMSEDPMAILALTGGIRGTDDIELFRPPVVDPDGFLRLKFFARGIRHLSKEAIELIGTLKKGQQLFFSPDWENAHDPFALALRSSEPPVFAGYCPKYYAKDLGHILNSPDAFLEARVQAVNLDAPLSMRLLCLVTGKVLENGASLHAGSDFNPINDTTPADWKGLNLELASL